MHKKLAANFKLKEYFSVSTTAVLSGRLLKMLRNFDIVLLLFMSSASVEGCSDIFKYVQGSYGVEGAVTISNVQLQQTLKLEIHLSIASAIQGVN